MNQVKVTDTIKAKPRTSGKKGIARKLRNQGLVPAVAYGPSREPLFLSLESHTFGQLRQKFGASHIYNVEVEGGESFKALLKDVDRDPVSREFLHVDFYAVDMNRPIRINVPVELVGKHAGAIDGGLLSQTLRSIEVQCLPNMIPAKITADVTHLGIGMSLHISELKFPEGVKPTSRSDESVAIVVEPDSPKEATPAEAAAGADAAKTAAAGAKPAAGAAAAKPAPAAKK